jgi:hypothetical protein
MILCSEIILGHVNMSDNLTALTNKERRFWIRFLLWRDVEPVCLL